MIKKTLLLTFLYILTFSTTFAQNPKQEIEKTGWKFIMMDKKQKPLLEKILPLQLTKDL